MLFHLKSLKTLCFHRFSFTGTHWDAPGRAGARRDASGAPGRAGTRPGHRDAPGQTGGQEEQEQEQQDICVPPALATPESRLALTQLRVAITSRTRNTISRFGGTVKPVSLPQPPMSTKAMHKNTMCVFVFVFC